MKNKRSIIANVTGILLGIVFILSGISKNYVKDKVNKFFTVLGIFVVLIYIKFFYDDWKNNKYKWKLINSLRVDNSALIFLIYYK